MYNFRSMEKMFDFVQQDVSVGITIVFVCCVFIIIATLLDFWSAVEAGKARKEKLSSHPILRTGRKIIDYLILVFFVLMIDVLGLLCFSFYGIPYFVVIITIGILLREGLSMKENYKLKKSDAIEAVNIATEIIKCITKEDAERIIKYINNNRGKH